jgi:hypothetical protein
MEETEDQKQDRRMRRSLMIPVWITVGLLLIEPLVEYLRRG